MKKIIDLIKKLEGNGINNVNLIALISENSSEVLFYGDIEGVRYQSNNMVEEGKVDINVVDGVYNQVISIVKADKKYDKEKMNIIKANNSKCDLEFDQIRCKSYKIIKEWKKKIENP